MKYKDNIFRVKVEFEETPIFDEKVKGVEGLDSIMKNLKKKFK